jgi:hypothetical protein
MKTRYIFALTTALLASACSGAMKTPKILAKPEVATIRLTLLPQEALAPGTPVTVLVKLNHIADLTVVTPEEAQKLSVLVADTSLSDVQSLTPAPTKTPGLYSIRFTPKSANGYRAWADFTAAGKRNFVVADLGQHRAPNVAKTISSGISFDKPLAANETSLGTIGNANIIDVIGMYDDAKTVIAGQPDGKSGFRITPPRAGYLRLLVKTSSSASYAPFGVTVGN